VTQQACLKPTETTRHACVSSPSLLIALSWWRLKQSIGIPVGIEGASLVEAVVPRSPKAVLQPVLQKLLAFYCDSEGDCMRAQMTGFGGRNDRKVQGDVAISMLAGYAMLICNRIAF
jgi:hypothetical protein